MIEVVYKDEKQRAKGNEGIFQLPRNVRQIGMTDQNYRIYLEDYVYSFLERVAAAGEDKEEKERRLAVFMGETKWDAGTGYLFISIFFHMNMSTQDIKNAWKGMPLSIVICYLIFLFSKINLFAFFGNSSPML